MKNDPHAAWSRLLASVRATRAAAPIDSRDDSAPFGFATRVVSLWQDAREADRRLVRWQRLSWRAAVASLVVGAAVAISLGTGGDAGVLVDAPPLPLPGLDAQS